jgi:hypothetical protein
MKNMSNPRNASRDINRWEAGADGDAGTGEIGTSLVLMRAILLL